MKQRYRLYIFPLLLLLVSISFSACEKDKRKVIIHEQLNPKEFNIIGVEHNKALASVYQALVHYKNRFSNARTAEYTIEGALDVAEYTTLEYIDGSMDDHEESYQLAVELVHNIYNHIPVSENDNIYTAATTSYLSPAPLQLLDELNVVLSDDDLSLSSLQSRITAIEARVPELNLTVEEQGVMYSATSVGRHTLEYWNAHYDDWLALNGQTLNKNATINFNWKQVGKHDVAGAVSGAVVTGVARLFGPIGWKIWASAIVGGAAGASAYDAIMQLW